MENEQVVSEVEVSPEIQELETQIEANQVTLENNQKLADEILEERQEFLKKMEQDLFIKEKNLTLKENGLEAYADIITATDSDELAKVVKQLNKIVLDQKVQNGYIPKETNGTQDVYTQAIQNGDVKNAIGFKLANLFKK
jgi:SMC interacting uncharacterized protein involved in chromosome segregation